MIYVICFILSFFLAFPALIILVLLFIDLVSMGDMVEKANKSENQQPPQSQVVIQQQPQPQVVFQQQPPPQVIIAQQPQPQVVYAQPQPQVVYSQPQVVVASPVY